MDFLKVTITGPKATLLERLDELRGELEAHGSAGMGIKGEDPAENVVVRLVDDDYGEGPDAPLFSNIEKGSE